MKIVFVNLYDYFDIDRDSVPLGILSLATVLNNNKRHFAEVVDLHRIYGEKTLVRSDNLDINIKESADYILAKNPDCVGLYTMNNTQHIAVLLAKYIKDTNENIKVLLGGPQATLVAKDILEEFEFIDGIGLGEGENTIESILDGIEKNDLSHATGIAYRDKKEVICKNNTDLIEDLDKLPFIDFDLLNHKIASRISIDVGRGCYFSCSFCSTKIFWKKKFRIKSAQRIFDEVVYYQKKYNVNDFSFQHDLFVANKKLIIELCELFIDNNVKVNWWCSSRIDTIDEEMLEIMSRAGCEGIYFGVEAGSQRMQSVINKNLKLDKIDDLIDLLIKYNIHPTFSFIYGFPEETYEDINETLNFLYHIYDRFHTKFNKRKVELQLHKLVFLAQTEVTNKYHDLLEYSSNYHMDASKSIESWQHEYLLEIIKNKNVFPHFYEIQSKLRDDLRNLDIAFNTVFVQAISYLDVTYRLILKHFNNDNLDVYYGFKQIISEEELFNLYHYNYNSLVKFINDVFQLFEKFVFGYDFGDDNILIRNIFDFEKEMFQFLRDNNDKDYSEEYKDYKCDVIKLKASLGKDRIIRDQKLRFLKNGNSSKVEEVSFI